MLDKSEWFKTKWSKKTQDAMGEESPEDVRELVCSQAQSKRKPWKRFGKQQSVKSQSQGRSMKTRTVLFVEQTRDGLLAKSIREVLTRLEGLLGFKVKVVERAGTSLRNLMPNTNPWAGSHCTRSDCTTCNQDMEDKPDCTKRNLVYENICADCNPEAKKKGELKMVNNEVPSVYVGETARSLKERAKEHWEAFKSQDKDSHIWKHWVLHHGAQGETNFIMKVVQFHRSALSRQVGEAIRIRRSVWQHSIAEENTIGVPSRGCPWRICLNRPMMTW